MIASPVDLLALECGHLGQRLGVVGAVGLGSLESYSAALLRA